MPVRYRFTLSNLLRGCFNASLLHSAITHCTCSQELSGLMAQSPECVRAELQDVTESLLGAQAHSEPLHLSALNAHIGERRRYRRREVRLQEAINCSSYGLTLQDCAGLDWCNRSLTSRDAINRRNGSCVCRELQWLSFEECKCSSSASLENENFNWQQQNGSTL